MSTEITSILQTLAPLNKSPGQARGAPQQSGLEKPASSNSAQVSIGEPARLLQRAESKLGQTPASPSSRSDSTGVDMTYARPDSGISSNGHPTTDNGTAQRPSPAMANMLEAFYSTSDSDSFDVNSDLNADGVINFLDLAALRDKEMGAGTAPPEHPKDQLQNMMESFFSSEGSKNFDAASDLNNDGTINFHDLAVLRTKMQNN